MCLLQDIIGKARDAAASDYYKVCALYDCSMCIRKPFNLEVVQGKNFLGNSKNSVAFPEYNDRNNGIHINDFVQKAQFFLDWLVSLMTT